MPIGYGYGGGGHSKGRLVVAGVIALIAIITFVSRREVNPVTGEKQFIGMSVDQEKALGLQAAPQMAQQMGGVEDPRTSIDARVVQQVGRKLVAQTDASKSPYVDNFNFHLLKDPETINAFALPGGQIFITRGLYKRLENEAELAGVLGHVIGRHSAEQMAKGQLGQMLATAVGVGASGDNGGQGAYVAAQMANQMLQLRYGRGDETDADSLGVKFMTQAGYDPRGMLGVIKVLIDASKGSRQPEFMSTHPDPQGRFEAVSAIIKKYWPNGIPSDQTNGPSLPGEAR
jgi:predicted Zn-dependent protease